MMNVKKSFVNQVFSASVLTLLAVTGFVISPVNAQVKPAETFMFASTQPLRASYESIYVVITAHTDKGMLDQIENKLKNWGVHFKATEAQFNNGLLTSLTVEVEIPGVYRASLTSGNDKDPLTAPVIFYHESSTKAGLSNGVPEELSAKGKLIVTDNLKGVVILHDGDSMEFSGTIHTNWKTK